MTVAGTVLIVEDDPGIAELERGRLEEAGYRSVLAASADEALVAIGRGGIDLVLLDYRLPGGVDGLEFYARVKAAGYDLPVILVTGFGNEATVIQALRIGVRDFVTKSLEYLDYLPEAVGRVLRQVGTERRLADSEARLTGVIESAKDAVIVVEADRRVSLFNPAAERMFGYAQSAALGRSITDFIPDELAPSSPASNTAGDSPSLRLHPGTEGVRAGGERFPVEASVSRGKAGRQRFYTVVARDVTERNRAVETLRRSEAMLRRAEGMAHVAGWTFEVADSVYISSEEGSRICGTDTGPHRADELAGGVHPDDLPRVQGALREALAGTPYEIEHRLVVSGKTKWVNVRAEPEADDLGRIVRIVGVTQDITERKLLEEQFRQSQKMEAFGQLAGGVAHDFNNLLTIINGYSELLLNSLPEGNACRPLAAEILKAGERSAGLTRQLLTFSRKQMVATKILDLNAIIIDAEKMLHRLIGEDIRLATAPGAALWPVRADAGQIEQILLNLTVNARDAMPTGGNLTIETQNVRVESVDAALRLDARPGEYVLLAVSDTGHGMSDDVKAKVFEPFFTTKGPGRGTGLGLATVFGIVQQSGGFLGVYSEVGAGTTFKVYLPRAEGSGVAVAPRPVSPSQGSETILVVEDEEGVRALAKYVLAGCGYEVLEAPDGEAAIRLAEQYRGPIHLLLTDVIMPGAGGRMVADRLRIRRPDLRVLFVSGYTDDAVVRHGVLHETAHFLQKPFSPAALMQKVRKVLDASATPEE